MEAKRRLDKRTVSRYVDKGLVKKGEVDQHLKALPDETPNANFVDMELYEAEDVVLDDDLSDEEETEDTETAATDDTAEASDDSAQDL